MTNITSQNPPRIPSPAERPSQPYPSARPSRPAPPSGAAPKTGNAETEAKHAGKTDRHAAAMPVPEEENTFEIEIEPELRLRVRFDEPAGRFVYQGINPQSGEVERQFPPDEALQRIARNRDIAGLTLDEKL